MARCVRPGVLLSLRGREDFGLAHNERATEFEQCGGGAGRGENLGEGPARSAASAILSQTPS